MTLARRSLASLLSIACLTAAAAAQPPKAPAPQPRESAFSITGTVVNSTTGAPVPRCRITASLNNTTNARNSSNNRGPGGPRRQQQETADTDDHGHFTLSLSSAGHWSLRATASGYRSQAYDEHEQYSSAVVLTEQAPTYDLLFHLTPDTSISGLIIDEAGEPVRQARVAAYSVPTTSDAAAELASQRAIRATTDDRGHYEIAGLAPGNYRLSVDARPWYTVASQNMRSLTVDANSTQPPPDPALDVIYPTTWYPGTADERTANVLPLRDGENREADIRLLPIPSIHLRIPMPTPTASTTPGNPGNAVNFRMPQVQPVANSSGGFANFGPMVSISSGQVDYGGLGPGIYRVVTPGENGRPGPSTLIQITSNSSRTLDLTAAAVNATVTIQTEGVTGDEFVPLLFIDANNPRNTFRESPGGGPGGGFGGPRDSGPGDPGGFQGPRSKLESPLTPSQLPTLQPALFQTALIQPAASQPVLLLDVLQRGGAAQPPGNPRQQGGANGSRGQRERPPRTIELPPGDYLVYQEGSSNLFLTGLTLGTRNLPGRFVTIPDGASTLTVHLGSGRASISGFATLDSKPSIGAMVVLVPITFGQPGSLAEIHRDQTNTDGSYDLTAVIPGQYILIAIDHGWNVRWTDPATLSRYLANGIPLDLRLPSPIKQNLDAQLP
jgi:Carboxypeptidase regulatory-like domain